MVDPIEANQLQTRHVIIIDKNYIDAVHHLDKYGSSQL